MLKHLKRFFSSCLIAIMITLSLGLTSSQPALASVNLDLSFSKQVYQTLSNKQLIEEAKKFLNIEPKMFCQAYSDNLSNIDSSKWKTIEKGLTSTFTISQAIASASAAGAGPLAGYAGIASAVSQLGLGGITTAIAGMMGSSVTGAAATAVVTSAIGGPIVMSALLVGGTSAATFGTYELGKFAAKRLGIWAERYCFSR